MLANNEARAHTFLLIPLLSADPGKAERNLFIAVAVRPLRCYIHTLRGQVLLCLISLDEGLISQVLNKLIRNWYVFQINNTNKLTQIIVSVLGLYL